MLLGRPRQHVMDLVADMVELKGLLGRLRAQGAMACQNCVFGRTPTPTVLDNLDQFAKPAMVGNRLICLRSIEPDPVVSGYAHGGVPAFVLVHPQYSCILYEARR